MEVPGKKREHDHTSNPQTFCDSCKEDDEQSEATFYCTDCDDYLCRQCTKAHKRNKASKHHTLDLIDEVTRTNAIRNSTSSTCSKHGGRLLEFYCGVHHLFCCSLCTTADHASCKPAYIKDVVSGFSDKEDSEKLQKEIDELSHDLETNINSANSNTNRVRSRYTKFVSDVDSFCGDIHSILSSLKKALLDEAEKVREDDLKAIAVVSEKHKAIMTELSRMTNALKSFRGKKQDQQLFITVKGAEQHVLDYRKQLAELCDANTQTNYRFQQNETLLQILQSVPILGNLILLDNMPISDQSITDEPSNVDLAPGDDISIGSSYNDHHDDEAHDTQAAGKSLKQVRAKHYKTIDIKMSNDSENCLITGCVTLEDNLVALADHNNHSVKLVNIESGIVTGLVKLHEEPWDVDRLDSGDIAVSCKKQIVFISRTHLQVSSKTTTDGISQGLVFIPNTTCVTLTKPKPAVKIMDDNGITIKTFDKSFNSLTKFGKPEYIAAAWDGLTMYISDSKLHTVTSITTDGEIKFVYKHTHFREPKGLAVDEYGNIYAAAAKSDSVHYISSNGKLINILLDTEGDFYRPQAISLVSPNRLCVTHFGYGCNSITVYDLK